MKLLPFTFKATTLSCAKPGVDYDRAERKEDLRALKLRASLFDPSRVIFATGMVATVVGIAILLAQGKAERINAAVIMFSLAFSALSLSKEVALWRLNRTIAKLEASGGHTPKEELILANPYMRSCRLIWHYGILVEGVTDRWNAYVKRVEAGKQTRFDGDDGVRNDITTRLLRLQSINTSVFRLFSLYQQITEPVAVGTEAPTTPVRSGKRYRALVALSDGVDDLDLDSLEDLEPWCQALLKQKPELAAEA